MIITDFKSIDLSRDNSFCMLFAENDTNSHVIVFDILSNGEGVVVPEDATVKLVCKLANGTIVEQSGTVTATGSIRMAIPNEALSIDDRVSCELVISIDKEITKHAIIVGDDTVITANTETIRTRIATPTFYFETQFNA